MGIAAEVNNCGFGTDWGCGHPLRDGELGVVLLGGRDPRRNVQGGAWMDDGTVSFHVACFATVSVPTRGAWLDGYLREIRAKAMVRS